MMRVFFRSPISLCFRVGVNVSLRIACNEEFRDGKQQQTGLCQNTWISPPKWRLSEGDLPFNPFQHGDPTTKNTPGAYTLRVRGKHERKYVQ